jgi:hypothetical protein
LAKRSERGRSQDRRLDVRRLVVMESPDGDLFQQFHVWNDIYAVDFDDETFENWMIGYQRSRPRALARSRLQ